MLSHNVYFSLTDKSPDRIQELVAACKKHLAPQEGVVFFAAGPRAEDINWSVSDSEFDVVLQMVFASKALHDRYQDSPEHATFLDTYSPNWDTIRVFDAYVEGA